jgi:hypothetical protein
MALEAVLAAQHFPREIDDWEGLLSSSRTWAAWIMAFRLAHLKRLRQILASGGGEPLGRAQGILPEMAPTFGRLKMALNNLALVATKDTAILQQLAAANLALTATVTKLTATNKKLVDEVKRGGDSGSDSNKSGERGTGHADPFMANCWMHGHYCNKHHTSATCSNKAVGHCDDATALNTMSSSTRDKGWDRART